MFYPDFLKEINILIDKMYCDTVTIICDFSNDEYIYLMSSMSPNNNCLLTDYEVGIKHESNHTQCFKMYKLFR